MLWIGVQMQIELSMAISGQFAADRLTKIQCTAIWGLFRLATNTKLLCCWLECIQLHATAARHFCYKLCRPGI